METELPLVNDQNYHEFLAHPASVVVFGIVPCPQCEAFEPIVRQAAGRFDGAVRFGKAKMHVPGACREIKRLHTFASFPTTHFYKNGALIHRTEGKLEFAELVEAIEQHLLD